jgi:tyrosyl-tRNA synthetase
MMQKRGIALCKSVARRLIQQEAVYIDGQRVESIDELMPVVSRQVTIQDGDRIVRRYPVFG